MNLWRYLSGVTEQKVDMASKSILDVPIDYSGKPTQLWEESMEAKTLQQCSNINTGQTPKPADHIRCVCVSDTHSRTRDIIIPDADVLFHCGDFTMYSKTSEIKAFNEWLGSISNVPIKIVIPGNHDSSFDINFHSNQEGLKKIEKILTNCTYLCNSGTTVHGYKVYGCSHTIAFLGTMGFNGTRGKDSVDAWKQIPSDTEILLTHAPPLGIGDLVQGSYGHVGCLALTHEVYRRIQPKYHLFGHIHEGYGCYSNGITSFINCAICTKSYKPTNQPVVFDLPMKKKK